MTRYAGIPVRWSLKVTVTVGLFAALAAAGWLYSLLRTINNHTPHPADPVERPITILPAEIVVNRGDKGIARSVVFSKDDCFLVITYSDGTIILVDLAKHAVAWQLRLNSDVICSVPSNNGEECFVLFPDKCVTFDNQSRTEKSRFDLGDEAVGSQCTSSQKDVLYAGGKELAVLSCDLTGRVKPKRFRFTEGEMFARFSALSCSPDDTILATGTGPLDATISCWDMSKNFFPQQLYEHKGGVAALRFLPYGNFLASGSRASTLKIWDTMAKKEMCEFVWPQDDTSSVRPYELWSVVGSPHRPIIAAASKYSSDIRIWDIAKRNICAILTGHKDWVYSVAISTDGKKLVSGGADGKVILWDLTAVNAAASTEELPALSKSEIEEKWKMLGSEETAQAYSAFWELARTCKASLPFVCARLKETKTPEAPDIEKVVLRAVSERQDGRAEAIDELEQVPELALPVLRRVRASCSVPEECRRLDAVMFRLSNGQLSSVCLRQARSVFLLEYLNTKESRQFLRQLSVGPRTARLTSISANAILRMRLRE